MPPSLPKELEIGPTQEFERNWIDSVDTTKPRRHRAPQKFDGGYNTPASGASTPFYAQCSTPGNMSQRNRNPRDRARNTGHDNGEETALWNDIQDKVNKLAALEAKSKEVSLQIFDMEQMFKTRENNEGISEFFESL
jgi:hypothetical protein